MAAALISGGIDRVGIVGVDRNIGEAGVLAYVQDLLPGLASVRRLVEAAIATGRPERTFRGDEDGVAVLRTDRDSTDVLRVLQANVGPALPSVFGFVDSIAVIDAALRVVLSGPSPDDRWIMWVEFHVPNRERAFILKNRIPGESIVVRLPDSA